MAVKVFSEDRTFTFTEGDGDIHVDDYGILRVVNTVGKSTVVFRSWSGAWKVPNEGA